jgi:plasmid maintenance system antidote protein VapI
LPALKLSVTDAAKQLGVTRAALSRALNERATVSLAMALRG